MAIIEKSTAPCGAIDSEEYVIKISSKLDLIRPLIY